MTTIRPPHRRLWLHHNELARPSDRVELVLRLGVLLLCLLSLPFALTAGSETYVSRVALADEQARTLREVTATILTDTPAPAVGGRGSAAHTISPPASWELPDGTSRTGRIRLGDGPVSAGQQVPIWVDPQGNAVNPPVTKSGAVLVGVGVAVLVWVLVVALLVELFQLVRLALNRSRRAAWEHEWALVEPNWRRSA